MASMVLSQQDIDTEYPSLSFSEDDSGFYDQADGSMDPDDTVADVVASSRVTGYVAAFADYSSVTDGLNETPFYVQSEIDVYASDAEAEAYLVTLLDEPYKYEGVSLETGIITSVKPLEVPDLGDGPGGFEAVLEIPELEVKLLLSGIAWRRGSAVLSVSALGQVGHDHFTAVARLAERMDARVGPALIGELVVEPLPTVQPAIVEVRSPERLALA
jgi:hypothetical protein